MPKYLFAYHGGNVPDTPEEGKAEMKRWMDWYGDMGAAVVDGGAPVGQSHTVSKDGHVEDGGANPISGYSIIECDSYEAACAHAKNNPMVVNGSGSVEVAEIVEMGNPEDMF